MQPAVLRIRNTLLQIRIQIRIHFDADQESDATFKFDVDSDPDPTPYQNNANLHPLVYSLYSQRPQCARPRPNTAPF